MTPVQPLAIALTMGEPAGIGGEIAIKAWQARKHHAVPSFFVIDDPVRLEALARRLNAELPLRIIEDPEDAAALFPEALPVVVQPLAAGVAPGRPDPANGPAVTASIERAVSFAAGGRAVAVVTNPVNKDVLQESGFTHPGHTEFIAALAGPEIRAVMMLLCPGLRVVPVTVHLGLRDAIAALDTETIAGAGRIAARALSTDFAVERPTLAVAGLNPHAGEAGRMGREEIEIIAPAIQALLAEGIEATGPHAADSLFHPAARERYDAALCMYHDQALIPIKTIDFMHGVNATLGLPFVRTSPDHGTAFDIAGTGQASETSLVAALRCAANMAANRARAAKRHRVA